MEDDPYPDVPDDAEGGDAIVRVLSEMDESHLTKATALVGMAEREWQLAIERDEEMGRYADVSFEEFAALCSEQWEEALEQHVEGDL